MENNITKIAQLEMLLRCSNGTRNILNIDNLIISDNDQDAVNKLKKAVEELHKVQNELPLDYNEEWVSKFTKQVRISVDRAKQKKK